MYDFAALEIAGPHGPLLNTFVRQPAGAQHLGILLPGIAYTTDMPLLYYARAVLLAMGAETLSLEVNYARQPGFRGAAPAEQYRWLGGDATAAVRAALAQRPYQRITLVGKSIGTLALGALISGNGRLAGADCVWLTPLVKQEQLRAQIQQARPRSLFVAGGADSVYDAGIQAGLVAAVAGKELVIPGANHSLEIPGDVTDSLMALEQVTGAIAKFLDG